jgi:hypothetical protein
MFKKKPLSYEKERDFTNVHDFIFQLHFCLIMFPETWNGGPLFGTNESKTCTLYILNILYIWSSLVVGY